MDKSKIKQPGFSVDLNYHETANCQRGFPPAKSMILIICLICGFFSIEVKSQNNQNINNPDKKRIEMTSFAFGGTGVLFTQAKGQFTAMTGGRGSATFNNRFTFGGAGWGMIKGLEVNSINADVYQFFKFGYGGLEFGYVFYPGDRIRLGSNMLLAYGAGFNETVPASSGTDFKMFPVLEPSVYWQLSMGKYLKLDIGVTWRYVPRSNFSYISSREMSSFSVYLAVLTTSCRCNE